MPIHTVARFPESARQPVAGHSRRVALEGSLGAPWWMWPHVTSLDAPLVAVVWQWWWARAVHVSLPWRDPLILGLGVWLIYLVDRLVDTTRAAPGEPVLLRHTFHLRWRAPLSALAVIAAGTLVVLTPCFLARAEFAWGLGLLALALAYFQLVHGRGVRSWAKRLPKEAAVGGMFAVGTMFFPLNQSAVINARTLCAAVLFGGLCFCNCALITLWESHVQDRRDPTSLLNAFPRLVARLRPCCLGLAFASLASGLFYGTAVFLPLAGSGLLLALLDRQNGRLTPNLLRVLADVALLSPVVAACFVRL